MSLFSNAFSIWAKNCRISVSLWARAAGIVGYVSVGLVSSADSYKQRLPRGLLFGLSESDAKATVSTNCRAVLLHGGEHVFPTESTVVMLRASQLFAGTVEPYQLLLSYPQSSFKVIFSEPISHVSMLFLPFTSSFMFCSSWNEYTLPWVLNALQALHMYLLCLHFDRPLVALSFRGTCFPAENHWLREVKKYV